jgi:hypothetical protein
MLDTQFPYIQISRPIDEEMVNEGELEVEVLLEGGLSVTVDGHPVEYGSAQYPEGAGYLKCTVNLTEGMNTIHIRAEDAAGNTVSLERSVRLDLVPPWISITSPSTGQVLSRPEVMVKGTVEPGASLFVMDEAVSTTSGFFERTILAVEGPNTLTVTAIDPAGNVATGEVTIVVDTIAPGLVLTNPSREFSYATSTRYVISGTVDLDDEGVPTAAVLIDGKDHTTVMSPDGTIETMMISILPDGSFTIPLDLEEGRNDISIEALDSGGNMVVIHRTIFLDNILPYLVVYLDPVTEDEHGDLRSHALTLNISGFTEPESALFVQGIPVMTSKDGRFHVNVDLLARGLTVITVSSTDPAGNTRTVVNQVLQAPRDDGGRGVNLGCVLFPAASLVALILTAILMVRLVRSHRDGDLGENAFAPPNNDEPGKGSTVPAEEQKEEGR